MKKRLIIIVCIVILFIENLPEGIITSAIEKSIVGKNEKICSNYNNKIINNYDENIKGESSEISIQNNEEELGLDKVKFSAYINKTNDLLFSIGFNILEKKFTVENQLDKNISEETPEEVMYKIRLYDKEGKEKLEIELNGSDTGNSKKLEPLKNLSYEIGDFVQIIPVNKKDVLKITGNIQGDITKEKEDYLDGIDNYDYIENVRFEIADDHLNSIYNEAPVISGLNDIIDSENPNNDIFTGISVKDDHDGIIDNSKLEVEVIQLQDGILEVRYIAIDSWGRKTIGSRRIFPKSISKLIDEPENQEEQIINDKELPTPNNVNIENASDQLTQNEIIVEGTPYYDTEVRRFRLRFDTIANQIQIMDEDGRQMSNSINGEYFKFVLYDKDMNIKSSVTLLGTDKSDTDKLNDIRNYLFEEGDYVGIWHAESQDKLKINGDIRVLSKNSSGDLVSTNEVKHYNEGVPQEDISTRRFRIKNSGLEEVINEAPQIAPLAPVEIIRGSTDFDPLNYIKNGKITDDFDEFTEDNLDSKVVSITYSPFDTSKVGEQIIVYTVTDSWGKSNTAEMRLIVKSTNPLDEKFIEFKNGDESLFKIKFDSVKNQFLVDDLDNVKDEAIDLSVSSSIFKLRIYTNDGVLQKTLNIKGTDNLRSMLKRFDGYQYAIGACIELWSNNPKNIVISGVDKNSSSEGDGENSEDYSDGIDNSDFMKNVRFEIGESTLTYIYNEAPRFIINSSINLEVNRNGSLSREELMEGLRVEDDHDGNTLNEKVVIGDFDTNTIGEKEIEYSVVDSWGRSSMIKRKITVYPYSPLEYNYITIKNDETDEVILTIRFDDENKRFVVDKIDKSKVPSRLKENDKIFELKLIKDNKAEGTKINGNNSESEEEVIISLTNSDLLNNEVVNKINNLSYKGFRYISLWCYDSKDGIFISGKSDIILNGFENEEKMENTRFEIKSEGLQVIYNEAPVIIGLNKILYVYKNDDITQEVATNGIEVKDDTDEISLSSIEITDVDGRKLKGEDESKAKEKFKFKIFNKSSDDYVETDEIRDFILNYKVTDAWGRSATYQRNVSVISKSASNDIEFYSADGNNKLFSINYNPISNIFDVKGGMVNEENFEEQQNEIVFKLTVFNVDEEKVGEIQLTEAESRNVEEIEKRLEDITVYDGYYFSLWSSNLVRLRINGYMTGNNELGESGDGEQDYSQIITSNDYIDNVRFNLTEDGIHVIYNKPPKIRFLSNDILTVYAGDPINYTENIQVVDDRDNPENNHIIDNNKIKVSFIDSNEDDGSTVQGDNLESNEQDNGRLSNGNVEEKTEEEKFIEEEKKHLRIGNNTVRLTVQDSWGRESTITRDLVITNGIPKNTIKFMGGNQSVLEIGFDPNNNRLILKENNIKFGEGNSNNNYVGITIKKKTGNNPYIAVNFSGNEKPLGNQKLSVLKSYNFEYGDTIVLNHQHPFKLKIDGTVINAREDYTDGVQNVENIINTEFEITKSGLKAVYTNPDSNLEDKNIIFGPMAPEKFPFKIKADIQNRRFNVLNANNNDILYAAGSQKVYKVVHINKERTQALKILHLAGRTPGNQAEVTQWDNRSFEYGDYLYIEHKEPNRSIIKGNIKNAREDYSNGVDYIDNMNHAIFKLTPDGVEAVYNEAPVFEGVENTDVYKGETFNPLQGVKVTDDFDTGHLRSIAVTVDGSTTSITTTSNGTVLNPSSISFDTSQLGEKTITYTATDRWGKIKTVKRKVTVRPKLYKNVFKVYADTIQSEIPEENIVSESESTEDDRTPLFEIGFDSVTRRYRVFNQINDRIAPNNPSEKVFGIQIIGSNKELKKEITLTGNDRGNSPKLDELNNTEYVEGDIIRVYRSDLNSIKIIGTVTGDIPNKEDISDEIKKLDYMTNTGFKISNDGLEAVYNAAPDINGNIEDKTISKGSNINLLEGLTASDDHDTQLSERNIKVYVDESLVNGNSVENSANYTFDSIGKYTVHYYINDSWGRATIREQTITVESKVRENEIEVYGPNQDLAFKATFNTTNNQIVLKANETPTASGSSTSQDRYFEMVVRNIKGEEKYRVTLNGDRANDTEQLAKIHEAAFNKYDTISLYGKTENTVKIIGGVIQESNKNTKINNNNYENGFGDVSRYPLVRFKITDDGLKEITQKEMLISGLDNKTIKRGEEVDYLSGILVNLQDINNEDYKITVNEEDKSNLNNLKEGNYKVRYTISNSWGTQKEQTRTITVKPRTKLEENKLSVKNNNDEVIMIIGFDSIQRKLRVIDYTPNSTIDSNNGKLAFVINAYDSLGNTIGTIELKGTEIISEDIVTRLNNFPYVEGYRLSIWAKDESKHLVLDGDVKSGNKNTEKALKRNSNITPTDKMENGRFEILDDGLVYYYNQAPEIHGGDNELVYYKGSILTLPNDISVTDDYDQISANQVVINDDKVDYDTLGQQDITYIVEDSWGRVTEKPAKINVMSSIDKNEFNIYPMNGNDTVGQHQAFSIQFVREDGKNKIRIGNQDSSFNFYPSNSGKNKTEKTFMTISIYNKSNTLKQSFELLGNENAINSKGLNDLNDYEFEFGDYIAIEGLTEASKKCARINGTVVNAKESYVNGVENIDNIQHVRFKFTDVGLESVYNEAPKITIDQTINLDAVKGDDIPYMRGVKLKDDHDKLTQANVEVTWNPNEKPTEEYEPYNDVIKGVAKVGENILHYKVTDSWGRTCEGERTINLSNGILDNSIVFKGGDRQDLIKFTFVKCTDNRNNGVTLKVDILDGDTIFAANAMSYYYTVKVTLPNGESHTRKIYSDYSYNNQNRKNGQGSDPFGIFKNLYLPYGSTFEFIDTGHPFNLSIHGRVRNQREDYSDGVQNPDNLRSIKFMVTDSGLKSVYVEKDDIKTNQNIISVVSTESIPLQLKIDPETKQISSYSSNHVTFYWNLGERIKVFNITLTGKNGEQKFSIDGYSRDKGNVFSNAHFSRPKDYEIGDKLTIWHYTPNRISIKGPIENQREDYSDGVDNEKNLTEAVFTLTENGLEAVYKEAPKITGIKDTKILKGGSLDLDNLIDELEAKDTIDGKYEDKVIIGDATQFSSVSSDIRIIDPKSVNTISETTARRGTLLIDLTSINRDQVGMYEVSYRVTNSNDRTTRKSSTIVVYDKPTITESSLSRIELNSVEHTEEAIINRLKEAVIVSDDDDTLYKKTTKLEVLKQNVNPNEEGIYNVDYKATDLYGEETVKTIPIQVSRTINVSVPTTIPFQVATNLKDKTTDEFISGVMKVQNNNTSDVNVYIQSFTRQESSFTTKTRSYKNLEIVQPSEFEDWNSLSSEDTMTKMALGIYNKEGLIVDRNLQLTKESPLWLYEDISNVKLGVLNRAQNLANPYTSKLSFTSKHGKNFIGGTSRSKFNLVFRFE